MTPEEQQMLRESLELSRKNNEVLNKLYRASLWDRAVKGLYWLILIGITVGSFYFIRPYIDALTNVYGGFNESKNQMKALFDF